MTNANANIAATSAASATVAANVATTVAVNSNHLILEAWLKGQALRAALIATQVAWEAKRARRLARLASLASQGEEEARRALATPALNLTLKAEISALKMQLSLL